MTDETSNTELYDLLGVSPKATAAEIKKAYRAAVKTAHPDNFLDAEKEAATVRFQSISDAYAILKDAKKREKYDTEGVTENEAQESIDARAKDQIVDSFFDAVETNEFPEEKDLLKIVAEDLAGRRTKLARNIQEASKKKRKYERVRGRIHTTREDDPLKQSCDIIITGMERQIEGFEEQAVVLARAETILKEYSFDWIMEHHYAREHRENVRRAELLAAGTLSLPRAGDRA